MFSQSVHFWFEESGFSSMELAALFLFAAVLSPLPRYLVIFSALRVGFNGFPGRFICFGLAVFLTLVQVDPMISKIQAKAAELQSKGAMGAGERKKLVEFGEVEWRAFAERITDAGVKEKLAKVKLPTQTAAEASWARFGVAFLVSELDRAFRIALVLLLPLLVIDLICATALSALGVELTTEYVSFPLKLCLILSTSGWTLITQNLLQSYG